MAKAIARNFAKNHFSIQLAGRDMEKMERLKQDLINRYDATVSSHHFDAVDFGSHNFLIDSLPVLPDIIIYAAGYMADQKEAQLDWKLTSYMIDANYSGAVSIINKFALLFENRGSGTIAGISSVAGDRGRASNYIYGSTKAALTTYLSGLRNSLFKKNVQVLTIKPGFVYTKMTQHINLPPKLTSNTEYVAEKIFKAIMEKKNTIYIKPIWRWIMQIIRFIPEPIFKRGNL